jgi:hypothetical protein
MGILGEKNRLFSVVQRVKQTGNSCNAGSFGDVSVAVNFCDFYGEHAAFMTAKRANSENSFKFLIGQCHASNSTIL